MFKKGVREHPGCWRRSQDGSPWWLWKVRVAQGYDLGRLTWPHREQVLPGHPSGLLGWRDPSDTLLSGLGMDLTGGLVRG